MAMGAQSNLPPIPPDIVKLTGPRIVGYLIHWALFGILCIQVYLYYLAFPQDPLRNKLLVYSVFLLEIAQTLLVTDTSFKVFGTGYGNLAIFSDVAAAWFYIPVITGIVAFIAQAFYAYRLRVLSQSRWVALVIIFLAFIQLGGSIAAGIVLKRAGSFTRLLGLDYTIAATLWNGVSALCDIIIAIFMTYYLSLRRVGGMSNTNALIGRITMLVVETGMVTAVIATLNLVLANLPGKPSYYLATSETIAKFYSNSMMVVLNSRIRIDLDPSSASKGVISAGGGRVRADGLNAMGITTDSYEMRVGTQEEVAFPSNNEDRFDFTGRANAKGSLI